MSKKTKMTKEAKNIQSRAIDPATLEDPQSRSEAYLHFINGTGRVTFDQLPKPQSRIEWLLFYICEQIHLGNIGGGAIDTTNLAKLNEDNIFRGDNEFIGTNTFTDGYILGSAISNIKNTNLVGVMNTGRNWTASPSVKANANEFVGAITIGLDDSLEIGARVTGIQLGVVKTSNNEVLEHIEINEDIRVCENHFSEISLTKIATIPVNKTWEEGVYFMVGARGMKWGGRANGMTDLIAGGNDGMPAVGNTISPNTSNYIGQIVVHGTPFSLYDFSRGGWNGLNHAEEHATTTVNYLDYNRLDKSKAINSNGDIVPDTSPDWGIIEFDLQPNTEYTVIKPYNAIKLRLEDASGNRVTYHNTGHVFHEDWYKFRFETGQNVVKGVLEVRAGLANSSKIMVIEDNHTNTPTPTFVPFTDYGKPVKLENVSITFSNGGTNLKSRTIEGAIKEIDNRVDLLEEKADNIGKWNTLDGVTVNEFVNILSLENTEFREGYRTNSVRPTNDFYVPDPTKNIYTIQLGAWDDDLGEVYYILWTKEQIDDVCRQYVIIPTDTGGRMGYTSLSSASGFEDFKWKLQNNSKNEFGYYVYHLNRFTRNAHPDDISTTPPIFANWATFEYSKDKHDSSKFMVFRSDYIATPYEYIPTSKQYPIFDTNIVLYRKSLIGEIIYLWKYSEQKYEEGGSVYHKCDGTEIQKDEYLEFFDFIKESSNSTTLPTIATQDERSAYICIK